MSDKCTRCGHIHKFHTKRDTGGCEVSECKCPGFMSSFVKESLEIGMEDAVAFKHMIIRELEILAIRWESCTKGLRDIIRRLERRGPKVRSVRNSSRIEDGRTTHD